MEDCFDLRSFMLRCLRWWKLFIILIVIGGITLGLYKVIDVSQDRQNYNEYSTEYQSELELYEAKQETLLTSIASIELDIEKQKTYLEESILMQVDPYQKNLYSISFFVSDLNPTEYPDGEQVVKSPEKVQQIVNTFFASSELCDYIRKTTGLALQDKYLRELICFKTFSSGVCSIESFYLTPEVAQDIAESIYSFILSKDAQIQSLVENYKIDIFNHAANQTMDLSIDQLQIKARDALNAEIVNLEAQVEAFESLVAPILSVPSKKSIIVEISIFFFLGCFLGVLIALVFVFIMGSLDKHFSNPASTAQMCKTRIVGSISDRAEKTEKNKKLLHSLTSIIEGRRSTSLTQQQRLEIVKQNVLLELKKLAPQSTYQVLCTGSVSNADLEQVANQLVSVFSSDPITVDFVVSGNINITAATIAHLGDDCAVLLVEKRFESYYEDIYSQITALNDYSANLIGLLVLEDL